MVLPLLGAAGVLTMVVRPRLFGGGDGSVDLSLVVLIAIVALQLAPLPPRVRVTVSPASIAVDKALRLDAPADPLVDRARPLSIDPEATLASLETLATMVLVFWSARSLCVRGAARTLARSIGWLGLALAGVAMAQHVTDPKHIYWIWPVSRRVTPFGPFMDHGDLASWLVMAMPLTLSYVIGRVQSRHGRANAPDIAGMANIAAHADATTLWLAAAVVIMLGATVASLSRSGMTAAIAGLVALVWLSRAHTGAAGRYWLGAAAAAVLVIGVAYANPTALARRLDQTVELGVSTRRDIWYYTWLMARDFWFVGVGAGAYVRAMIVYQPTPHVVYFNHAHDQYLQIVAEGGLVLTSAVVATIAAGIWRARAAFAQRSPTRGVSAVNRDQIIREVMVDRRRQATAWVRSGALAGIAALAVQGIWESCLLVPANAMLFAVLAAVATFKPPADGAGVER